jgi:hypothetical protein
MIFSDALTIQGSCMPNHNNTHVDIDPEIMCKNMQRNQAAVNAINSLYTYIIATLGKSKLTLAVIPELYCGWRVISCAWNSNAIVNTYVETPIEQHPSVVQIIKQAIKPSPRGPNSARKQEI